jgi:hypothetical protein
MKNKEGPIKFNIISLDDLGLLVFNHHFLLLIQ